MAASVAHQAGYNIEPVLCWQNSSNQIKLPRVQVKGLERAACWNQEAAYSHPRRRASQGREHSLQHYTNSFEPYRLGLCHLAG